MKKLTVSVRNYEVNSKCGCEKQYSNFLEGIRWCYDLLWGKYKESSIPSGNDILDEVWNV